MKYMKFDDLIQVWDDAQDCDEINDTEGYDLLIGFFNEEYNAMPIDVQKKIDDYTSNA
jgi:hypothetical protein